VNFARQRHAQRVSPRGQVNVALVERRIVGGQAHRHADRVIGRRW
jgi:hypothetical protein